MAITSVNATAFIRSLIGEASAKYWTDAELTLYLQFSMAKVLGEFYPFLWERYKNYSTINIVAGTSEYDPPTDSYKVSQIQVSETGKKVRYIAEDEWYKYAYVDAGFTSSATAYFTVWYMKNLDAIDDFPDACRALIAVEAAIMARTKNEDVSQDLLVMQKQFRDAALTELTMTNMHDINEFADYSEQDAMDESYVWTWKGGKIRFATTE